MTVKLRKIEHLSFYIQSFSLTECIVIVGVQKYRGCLYVCVCVCVCLSVCVSVRAITEPTGPILVKTNPEMVPYRSCCVRLCFDSLT